jgi:LCP family protein required for cell wall assembly
MQEITFYCTRDEGYIRSDYMNFKVFIRLILLILITFSLVAGVVAGGVALSYRIAGHDDGSGMEFGAGTSSDKAKKITEKTEEGQTLLNVVLLGVDADGYRTDVIILAQYDLKTKRVNMLQIPRDTKIETTRSDKKINSAYAFGKEQALFEAIKNLLNVDVDKYVLVNLKGFRTLIDEIGGVKVNVPINMYYEDPYQGLYIKLNKGEQVLNGKQAEMFVRFRKNSDGTGYPDGDLGRMKAQQEFINAVIDKALSLKNIFKIPKLVAIVIKNVKTNFEVQEIGKYIGDALQLDKSKINMMMLPGDSGYIGGISYFLHDKEKTDELIKNYFTPSEEINEGIEKEDLGNNNQQEGSKEEKEQSVKKEAEYKPSWKNRFIKVEVLNGSNTDGAAAKVAEDLKQKGFNVVRTGNFGGVHYSKTKAVDRTTKGYAKEISKALGEIETDKDLDKDSKIDVTVIVGNDISEIR